MADELFDPELGPTPYDVVWHAPGKREYFLGIDRGMLYLGELPGVPWNGLVSVEEKPIEGGIVPFYIDGIRRRNDQIAEEFGATITAFSAPPEFSVCEGEVALAPGLYLGQQQRQPFGFSYRSFQGNDVGGALATYDLNIVYNALAEPTSRKYVTYSNNASPDTKSWTIQTLPVDVSGHSPAARIRLRNTDIPADRLDEIQRILYGYEGVPPRIPTIVEIEEIISRPVLIPWDPDIPWIPDPPETGNE